MRVLSLATERHSTSLVLTGVIAAALVTACGSGAGGVATSAQSPSLPLPDDTLRLALADGHWADLGATPSCFTWQDGSSTFPSLTVAVADAARTHYTLDVEVSDFAGPRVYDAVFRDQDRAGGVHVTVSQALPNGGLPTVAVAASGDLRVTSATSTHLSGTMDFHLISPQSGASDGDLAGQWSCAVSVLPPPTRVP